MIRSFIDKLRHKIAYSKLHEPIMRLISQGVGLRIKASKSIQYPTIYVVSPYKTGTTYLDSLWSDKISRHEPFHFYSLQCLSENFDEKFKKRSNVLKLRLECSGFLSLFITQLP